MTYIARKNCNCAKTKKPISDLAQCSCKFQNKYKSHHTMDAQSIVNDIGAGVKNALYTCERFLGLDRIQEENADIHTEYIMTVKIAEEFARADVVVRLENQMNELRNRAKSSIRHKYPDDLKQGNKEMLTLEKMYSFGQKRIDISVAPNDERLPPHLITEIKLGVGNKAGIHDDMERVVKLMEMFKVSGALDEHSVYGAVIFHMLYENIDEDRMTEKSNQLIEDIKTIATMQQRKNSWLKFKVGILDKFSVVEDEPNPETTREDDAPEELKKNFKFAPALVLYGNADDVVNVDFNESIFTK